MSPICKAGKEQMELCVRADDEASSAVEYKTSQAPWEHAFGTRVVCYPNKLALPSPLIHSAIISSAIHLSMVLLLYLPILHSMSADTSIWLNQFIKAMRDERGDMIRNAHLLGFFRRICRCVFGLDTQRHLKLLKVQVQHTVHIPFCQVNLRDQCWQRHRK